MTMPFSVCANYIEYDGIVYGVFNCPVFGYDVEANMCCGPVNQQFCCTIDEFLATTYTNNSTFMLDQELSPNSTRQEFELSNLYKILQNNSYSSSQRIQAMEEIKLIENSMQELRSENKFDSNGVIDSNDLPNLYEKFKNNSIIASKRAIAREDFRQKAKYFVNYVIKRRIRL
jgi:hypothetical protein